MMTYWGISQQYQRTRPGLFKQHIDYIIFCPVAHTGCTWVNTSPVMLDIPSTFRVVAEHLEKTHQAVNITPFPGPDWENTND